jgi:uncharacterized protein DUF87
MLLDEEFPPMTKLGQGAVGSPCPVGLEPHQQELKPYERPLDKMRLLRVVPSIFDQSGLRGFTALLKSLHGVREAISLEVIAQKDSILNQIVCQQDDLAVVRGAIQAHLTYGYVKETVRLKDPFYSYVTQCFGSPGRAPGFYFKTARLPPPFFYAFDSENDAMSPLYRALEQVTRAEDLGFAMVQVLVLPVRNKWEAVARGALERKWGSDSVPRAEITDLNKKFGLPCFATAIRVCAFGYKDSARALVQTVCAGLSSVTRGKDGRGLAWSDLEEYEKAGLLLEHQLHFFKARVSFHSGMILNSQEVAKFCRFPTTEILSKINAIVQAPRSYRAPHTTDGIVLGENWHKGESIPVSMGSDLPNQHVVILGESGYGKSTLFQRMVAQHIERHEGFGVLDPHGKLVEQMILPLIPKERIADVVYLDVADTAHPVAFNVLANEGSITERRHLRSDLLNFFEAMIGEKLSLNIEHILSNLIQTLLTRRDSTVAELEKLMIDEAYRRRIVASLDEPRLLAFWDEDFPKWRKSGYVLGITNKLGPLLASDSALAPMLVQRENRVDFVRLLNERKIVLVNLSQGQIGRRESTLLGKLLLSKMQIAAMMRGTSDALPDWYLYVDEFHYLATPSMNDILTGTRKFKLHLRLASTGLGELPGATKSALSNPATFVFFRLVDKATQAEAIRILAEKFAEPEIGGLGLGEAFCKMGQSIFNLHTFDQVKTTSDFSEEVKTASRDRYTGAKVRTTAVLTAPSAFKAEQEEVEETYDEI